MTHALHGWLSVAFATTALAACSGRAPAVGTATDAQALDAADIAASNAQSSHMAEIVYAGIPSQDPAAAATGVATSTAGLWPAGCSTRAKDPANPNVVHITLDDCTGPFGLVHLSGEVTITFSRNADGSLHAEHVSDGLTANGHPVTHTASADITLSGSDRDVKWRGTWIRVNARGETVVHTSDMTIVVDVMTHCRDANGTAQTKVGAREIDSTIDEYKICREPNLSDGCPDGTITHHYELADKTVTIVFDGSDEATVSGPNGSSRVALVCGG